MGRSLLLTSIPQSTVRPPVATTPVLVKSPCSASRPRRPSCPSNAIIWRRVLAVLTIPAIRGSPHLRSAVQHRGLALEVTVSTKHGPPLLSGVLLALTAVARCKLRGHERSRYQFQGSATLARAVTPGHATRMMDTDVHENQPQRTPDPPAVPYGSLSDAPMASGSASSGIQPFLPG